MKTFVRIQLPHCVVGIKVEHQTPAELARKIVAEQVRLTNLICQPSWGSAVGSTGMAYKATRSATTEGLTEVFRDGKLVGHAQYQAPRTPPEGFIQPVGCY